MYYQVPTRPEPGDRPTPIFPWEREAKKPTRVFASPPSTTAAQSDSAKATQAASAPTTTSGSVFNTTQAKKAVYATDVLDSFSRTNAWDNVTSIEQYVRAVREAQAKRGKIQVLHHATSDIAASAISDTDAAPTKHSESKPQRRESLILTDFPTEVERPSLPVTPAPIRRPKFWGEERDEQGELPAAEGVPDQAEWDPHERLEQLRRSSVAAAEELPKQASNKEIPLREVPETSAEATSETSAPTT